MEKGEENNKKQLFATTEDDYHITLNVKIGK